jgi:DNA-binding transcriptional LysR family regulator
MRSNSASGLLTAARDGLGVTLLPAALAIDDLESGNLQSLLPEIVPPPLPVFLVYPKSRRASQKVQALQAFLADALAASPSWETRIGALPQVR